MEKHPVKVEGFDGSLEELAQKVCALRYDKLAKFFGDCADVLAGQGDTDYLKGRIHLATMLDDISQTVDQAASEMQEIFEFCAPHMKDELASES